MKHDPNSQINVNRIGLRSISYLKTSFHKVNSSKDNSVTQKPNTKATYFKQNAQTYSSSNYTTSQEKEFTSPFDNNSNTNDIFPNDSFGDSKKSKSNTNNSDNNNNNNTIQEDNCNCLPMNSGSNSNGANNYFSLNIDPRIEYVLKSLDLVTLTEVFYNYSMNFNDILFLSKEDCNELGLNMVQRNRLLKFCEAFHFEGNEYSYDEVVQFFKKKKKYIIKSMGREEEDYQTTACFASSSSRYPTGNAYNNQDEVMSNIARSNVYANEVFSPSDKNHEQAVWSQQFGPHKLSNRNYYQNKIPNNGKGSKRENKTKEYEENISMNTFNQIEHSTELQFSSSICNINNNFSNNGNINANKSSRRNHSQTQFANSYHKMNREIDQFMLNIVNQKKNGQPVSTKNRNAYSNVSTKKNTAKKKPNNYYLSSVGQLETANSSNYYQPKQSQHSLLPQSEAQTFDFSKSTQNQKSNSTCHRMNRNDSISNLHKFSKSSSSVDILTDFFKRKESLKTSLIDCNSKIHDSKKLLKLLEDNER